MDTLEGYVIYARADGYWVGTTQYTGLSTGLKLSDIRYVFKTLADAEAKYQPGDVILSMEEARMIETLRSV